MGKYILIDHIRVQNANTIAGFTWGFPAITHFLGFSHNLSRKISRAENRSHLVLSGCAVIAHKHQIHSYSPSYNVKFTQSRNPPYLPSHSKEATPPIIEEGQMNMTVSLLIHCEGNIDDPERLCQWIEKNVLMQRLAGGTVLGIGAVTIVNEAEKKLAALKHKLLPGFILLDRSDYLEKHYLNMQKSNPEAELFDAWLDFSGIKQKARPKSSLIAKHLDQLAKNNKDNAKYQELLKIWETHLANVYEENSIPDALVQYFSGLDDNKSLLQEWERYCQPDEKTDADWEYIPKPETGYLVPIMTGYKAISQVYKNDEVARTRDSETDVCFVESVHSVGEWVSVHRLGSRMSLKDTVWHYHHEDNWYLCRQDKLDDTTAETITTEPLDSW